MSAPTANYSSQIFPTDPHSMIEIYVPDVHNIIRCFGDGSTQVFMITSGSCTGRFFTKEFSECHCSDIRAQLLAQGITGPCIVYLNRDCSINLVNGIPFPKAK